ncbi:MAG: hypothetical protein ACT4N4_13350 [Rhodospirillales bacterium]
MDSGMNGARWKFLFLAAGVGWFAATAAYVRYAEFRAAKLLKDSAFEVCDYVGHRLVGYADCWRDLMTVASYLDNDWANLALLALAPALSLWLAAAVARTIRRARKK